MIYSSLPKSNNALELGSYNEIALYFFLFLMMLGVVLVAGLVVMQAVNGTESKCSGDLKTMVIHAR
ncbi:MAG: hypothetical protein M3224_06755 [Thermoproteota archaeon]|nr:hypothetical protein [Thermoproteota archaeon]